VIGMDKLYSIGDVARRTGLSVSAIRFYADEGVVPPTGLTEGGFRQYDVHAIARLELVRTLRDLGAGLGDIRRVLGAETTLHDLAVTHLRLIEDQLRQFRARSAVLRTIVRQHTTTEQVSLMHKLVSMSDDDRDRLINEFWHFVTDGLDVHPGFVEQQHSKRPHLPEEPSTEQLETWIELAEIVRDEEFRTALRDFFHRTFGTERGRLMASPEMTAHVERHRKLLLEAQASQQAGVPTDSPQARDMAERVAADSAALVSAMTGERGHDVDKARRGIVEFDRNGRGAQTLAKVNGLRLLTKYHALVATINGTSEPDPERAAAAREWMAAALRQGLSGE
jgi:DNA-binding transcriptional MerR regulator